MRLLLNLLWATVGGGFVIAIQYALGGLLLCLTVVGIPFGVQCFKLAGLAIWPFGREVVDHPDRRSMMGGVLGLVMNIIWLVAGGLSTFVSHVVLGFGLAVTVIGIPFALQHLKLAVLALFPFGRDVVEAG
jgi:uncharacterized membrane protein YccF (DUF307 family)